MVVASVGLYWPMATVSREQDRQTDTEREGPREKERETHTHRDRERQTDRQTETRRGTDKRDVHLYHVTLPRKPAAYMFNATILLWTNFTI